MLIENVIDHYIEVGKKHSGNPFRLSNSGRCVRALAELKSMSNYGFRNALQGRVDYGYRCQLNSYVVGGGLSNALWVCYRKETSHLLELFCSKKIERVETRILTPSGGWF